MSQEAKKISIVIPAYNEEELLERELEKIISKTNEVIENRNYEIVIVENGSTDKTLEIARELSARYPQIFVISLTIANYGSALKNGIFSSQGELVAVFNVDFWDVGAMKKALDILLNENCDIVVCSKSMKGARDLRPLLRRIVTRGFNLMLCLFFGYRGTDTHGVKFFKKEKILPIIKQCVNERDLLDTELLIRAQKAGLVIKEIPIVCEEKRKSVYGLFGKTPRILKDLILLFVSIHKR
ncbi:MAG: glycosyltransferase [Candidatus Niyogibacteria bacterium]|nr:glycosyltransferase [Candidatus Niyogibacteria bacterium]